MRSSAQFWAMIQVQEMLRQMKTLDERGRPQPFRIRFCTCDEQRQTGGKMLELENVVLSRLVVAEAGAAPPHVRKRKPPQPPTTPPAESDSINCYNPLTRDITTVHIRLITRFNDQIVID